MLRLFEKPCSIIFFGFIWTALVTLNAACESSTPPPSPSTSKPSTTPKKDPGDTTPEDDDPSAGEFDLCSTGLLANSRLSDFATYTKGLCAPSQLEALRNAESIFTGVDNKIIEKSKNLGDRTSTFTLMTSAIYNTDAETYWAMLRLQFLKPTVFSKHFERDDKATVTEIQPASDRSNVTFRYGNSNGDGGKVDYIARTELIQLAKGQAYVIATKLTESKETLTDLKGLIVVNKIDDNSVEVFTTSYQEYSHASGQGKTYYDRV